jgi:poly-gamma-glutamate capsule biosynthesis protein CapA/YwtB (metallophosphatase superfamily)
VRAPVALALLLAALTAARASAAPPPTRLTIAASGDLLIHAPLYARAKRLGGGRRYEFRPFLRYVRPWIAGADLALCHVETPMTTAPPAGYPLFNTPPALASAIAATGWDACSTASNHSLDRGEAGIAGTRRALARAGVESTGSFVTPGQRSATTFLEAKGVRVAFLSYTEMTNGIPLPRPWSVNLARARRILADARLARRRGADAVIVNLHWGEEFRSAPSAFQLALARRLAASGDITAIVGQHVHVVQPIRFLGATPVVFGEGNLLSNQSSACCPTAAQDGLIALLDVVAPARGRPRVERVRYLPTWVRRSDYAVLPLGDPAAKGLAPRSVLRTSYRRTVAVAGSSARVVPVTSSAP